MSTHPFNVHRPTGSADDRPGVVVATDEQGRNHGVVDLLMVHPSYRNVMSASTVMREAIQSAISDLLDAEMTLDAIKPSLSEPSDHQLVGGMMFRIAHVVRMLENANLAAEIGIEALHIQLQKGLQR
ncbi:hypothetical protein RU58_00034 [Achromobacter phage phiAxp-1]|uniref:hypothetical protein n=1 Tax=Achromobacter phage phiAxp-1 TaxID=1610509 RepID=UPI0006552B8A|nr:hypothetical protein RU58_00034 [Achromobacter phage phiAxp-1]AKJ71423.1 hypothetical protein RU58_00034 [Achromobacter phage phiAxp-1]